MPNCSKQEQPNAVQRIYSEDSWNRLRGNGGHSYGTFIFIDVSREQDTIFSLILAAASDIVFREHSGGSHQPASPCAVPENHGRPSRIRVKKSGALSEVCATVLTYARAFNSGKGKFPANAFSRYIEIYLLV